MELLLVTPILIPLITAVVMLLLWRNTKIQRWLDVASTAALLTVGLILFAVVWRDGIQAVQIGNWPAPFGITLVADLFATIMLVLIDLIGLVIAIYGLAGLDSKRRRAGYHPLTGAMFRSLATRLKTKTRPSRSTCTIRRLREVNFWQIELRQSDQGEEINGRTTHKRACSEQHGHCF